MNKIVRLLFCIAVVSMAFSCKDMKRLSKPGVTGKAGEVIVVTDKSVWEGKPGNELRRVLAVDYPQLPQREPSYNLVQITDRSFSSLFKKHRNIILLQIGEAEHPKAEVVTREDIWAAPQTVITISAPNTDAAAQIIAQKQDLLFNTLGQAERNRIIKNSKKYEERMLRDVVAGEFGGSPYFPNGYSLKKRVNGFIWISYETTYTNQGILIFKIPLVDTNSMKIDNYIAAKNEILKNNVPGMFENSYMTTSMQIPPVMKWMKYKGRDFAEIRGLWEVENDFMGGPFIDHAFYSKDGKYIIVVEGFVYAPKYPKRNYLRQIESIIYSWDWAEDFNK